MKTGTCIGCGRLNVLEHGFCSERCRASYESRPNHALSLQPEALPPPLHTFPRPMHFAPLTAKKRRGTPEADFQRALVRDLRAILLPPFVLHHSANEVRRGGREGRIAQGIAEGMGVHPGFADLVLLSAKQTVFFELKSATGTLSDDQIAFRDFVRGQGHGWALVRTLDDALAALKALGIPIRIKRT